jgi:hypothetical protein
MKLLVQSCECEAWPARWAHHFLVTLDLPEYTKYCSFLTHMQTSQRPSGRRGAKCLLWCVLVSSVHCLLLHETQLTHCLDPGLVLYNSPIGRHHILSFFFPHFISLKTNMYQSVRVTDWYPRCRHWLLLYPFSHCLCLWTKFSQGNVNPWLGNSVQTPRQRSLWGLGVKWVLFTNRAFLSMVLSQEIKWHFKRMLRKAYHLSFIGGGVTIKGHIFYNVIPSQLALGYVICHSLPNRASGSVLTKRQTDPQWWFFTC